jgi:uncharacterized membrane protein YoaK (UPF0700 family)
MSQSQLCRILPDTVVIGSLAFLGGFVDSACYLKLKGLFTSSITGNLVVICASVSDSHGLTCRSTCALSFLLAAFILNSVIQFEKLYFRISHIACLLTAYLFELAFLLATAIIGIIFIEDIDKGTIDSPIVILTGCLAGASMGFHCVAARESFLNCPPTTVMTNTMINVS